MDAFSRRIQQQVPLVGQRDRSAQITVYPVYLMWDDGQAIIQTGTTMHGPLLQRGDVRSFEMVVETPSGREHRPVHIEIDRVVLRTMRPGQPGGLFLVGHRVDEPLPAGFFAAQQRHAVDP